MKNRLLIFSGFFLLALFSLSFNFVFAQQNTFPLIVGGDTVSSASEFDYPPFSIIKEDGSVDGFSVELLREALKAVNLNVSFKIGAWSEIKNDLEVGNIRVLPLMGRTPERERVFDFSVPYYSIDGAVFVRIGDDTINNLSSLKNKEIAVMAGDNAEEYIRRVGISDFIVTTKTFDDAFKGLSLEEYDAVITQKVTGEGLLEKLNIKNVVALDIPLTGFTQHFAFAVRENDKEMLEKLNEGLSIITSNGTRRSLEEKWFPVKEETAISLDNVIKFGSIIIGAIFILFILILIGTLRLQVRNKTKKLTLEIDAHKKAEEELEASKKELADKNKELEKTLEDFYTMRIGLQRDLELGKVEEENEKIKRRLDNLRK